MEVVQNASSKPMFERAAQTNLCRWGHTMGQVVPFRRKSPLGFNEAELALLTSLNGNPQVQRRGGWATRESDMVLRYPVDHG
jgi:hypothetical protein